MEYYIEILKHHEVFTAILVTLAGIIYAVISCYRNKIFKGRLSIIGKLFSVRISFVIILLIFVLWIKGLDYNRIKEDAYYSSINPELRAYFEELMGMESELKAIKEEIDGETAIYSSDEISSQAEGDIQPLKSQFKAIAITSDTINHKVFLEERLNNELKKRGQYSIDRDSLDYIICFFQQWKKDYYYGNGGSAICETENAVILIADQKKHEVVDTIIIDINRNPEHLNVETNQWRFGSKEITLTSEELYDYCIGNRMIDDNWSE